LSLQYAYGQKSDNPQGLVTISDPFQNTLLYGLRWPIRDDLTFSFSGLWAHSIGASFNRISLEKSLAEHWTLEAMADQIHGPPDSLLGIWARQSRIGVAGLYRF